MKPELRVETLPIDEPLPDPKNPRSSIDEQADAELMASIALHGVKVPLICYRSTEGITIGDGHRRWRCSKAVGKDVVPAIVFPKRPEEAELLATQLTINAHRRNLNPTEEYDAFSRLAKLQGWTPSQLAEGLAISNAEVTRILSLGKLSTEERQLIREGRVSKSSGYALARMGQQARAGLVQKVAAGELTRDQLDAMARRNTKVEKRGSHRVCCAVPGGTVVVNCESPLSFSSLIDLLNGLVRNCRKLRSQKLDISTGLRVLHDQVRGATQATQEAVSPQA